MEFQNGPTVIKEADIWMECLLAHILISAIQTTWNNEVMSGCWCVLSKKVAFHSASLPLIPPSLLLRMSIDVCWERLRERNRWVGRGVIRMPLNEDFLHLVLKRECVLDIKPLCITRSIIIQILTSGFPVEQQPRWCTCSSWHTFLSAFLWKQK